MFKFIKLFLATAVVFLLIAYMVTFTVPFNETALVTTFGKAERSALKNPDGRSGGLFLRFPWPIQKIHRFDRRLRILSDRLEQQETSDRQVVVVQAYVTWRIVDGLDFYRSLRTSDEGERLLRDRLRTACSVLGDFRLDQLISPEESDLDLAEAAILARMKDDLADQSWGIELQSMGIKRILFPERITEAVFQRMRQTRQRMAQRARSEGEAIAKGIMAKAAGDSERIMAYARRRAQEIRSEGDGAAAEYAAVFGEHQDFALYLRQLETLQRTLSHNTTFILDSGIAPYGLLEEALAPKKRTDSR
nr:protease modulator HflC [uncultured Dethiosulfovibrio sp.]